MYDEVMKDVSYLFLFPTLCCNIVYFIVCFVKPSVLVCNSM